VKRSTTKLKRSAKRMPDILFYQTAMGRKFYEHDIPDIALQLSRIATALETLIDMNRSKPDTKRSHTKKAKEEEGA
jgi:hypothetical protein